MTAITLSVLALFFVSSSAFADESGHFGFSKNKTNQDQTIPDFDRFFSHFQKIAQDRLDFSKKLGWTKERHWKHVIDTNAGLVYYARAIGINIDKRWIPYIRLYIYQHLNQSYSIPKKLSLFEQIKIAELLECIDYNTLDSQDDDISFILNVKEEEEKFKNFKDLACLLYSGTRQGYQKSQALRMRYERTIRPYTSKVVQEIVEEGDFSSLIPYLEEEVSVEDEFIIALNTTNYWALKQQVHFVNLKVALELLKIELIKWEQVLDLWGLRDRKEVSMHSACGKKLFVYIAAIQGKIELLREFIESGEISPNVALCDAPSHSPLIFHTFNSGNVDLVELLLKNGAKADNVNWAGETLLHLAVYRGSLAMIRLLVSVRELVNFQSKLAGLTPLHVASEHCISEATKLLIENGAHLDIQTTAKGETPLHISIENDCHQTTKLLIESGANLNIRTDDDGLIKSFGHGFTPLHTAVKELSISAISLLIQNKANLWTQDYLGLTPFHLSSRFGLVPAMDMFVSAGMDVNIQDNNDWTPLMWAVFGGHPEAVQYLMTAGGALDDKTFSLAIDRIEQRSDNSKLERRTQVAQILIEHTENNFLKMYRKLRLAMVINF